MRADVLSFIRRARARVGGSLGTIKIVQTKRCGERYAGFFWMILTKSNEHRNFWTHFFTPLLVRVINARHGPGHSVVVAPGGRRMARHV